MRFPSLVSRTCVLVLGRRSVNPNITRDAIIGDLMFKFASTTNQTCEVGWRHPWCVAVFFPAVASGGGDPKRARGHDFNHLAMLATIGRCTAT